MQQTVEHGGSDYRIVENHPTRLDAEVRGQYGRVLQLALR
jgi:hypothetical protein